MQNTKQHEVNIVIRTLGLCVPVDELNIFKDTIEHTWQYLREINLWSSKFKTNSIPD